MNVQLQVLIASFLQLVLTDGEKNQIGMCSYQYLLPQSCSNYSERERRARQECAVTSPYCFRPTVGSQRHREELDRNVQLQVLIASVLKSALIDREQNQIGMCSYKSLLPQPCSWQSQTERRTRQECAATSPYCLSPAVSTQRESRTRQECAVTSPYCLSNVVSTKRQREELDRNVQLQVLIASVLQSVLTDGEKTQIGMCSYQYLLPQSCSNYSERERRTRQECAVTGPYCFSPTVSSQSRREELDMNLQLEVLIASVLTSVLTDTEQNQIGMFSYKSLLTQPCTQYSETGIRTRQECAATSPYCLSPAVSTHRRREELDRNVQLQVLIASALHSVLRDRDQNQIGMCSYKSLLPQSCSQYSETGSRTRQECAATGPDCLSPAVGTHKQREELDRNVQLQVLIVSALQSVLKDREKNQIGMCSLQVLIASVLQSLF